MAISDHERLSCNNSSLHCFGTGYIFEKRAAPLRVAVKCLSFSSLVGPIAIGALVISVGADGVLITIALVTASFLSFFQIIVSLWALSAQWQINLAYYTDSKADNYSISDRFTNLASNTNLSDTKWRQKKEVIETISEMRKQLDLRYDISDEEKRMGMLAALRNFSRPCSSCEIVPDSLKATDCTVCGQFKTRRVKWLI